MGLIKRNCSITTSKKARKTLYLSLVRSLFEHCSQVWRPTTATQIQKFERLQKRAVKWVLNERYCRYSDKQYFLKLKGLDILPLDLKFELNDMTLFHKIFHDMSVLKFPSYIVKQTEDSAQAYFQRQTRTFNDSDRLKLKSTIAPKVEAFKNSYFYRSLNAWNSLPLEIRSIESSGIFKMKVESHLWAIAESKIK